MGPHWSLKSVCFADLWTKDRRLGEVNSTRCGSVNPRS